MTNDRRAVNWKEIYDRWAATTPPGPRHNQPFVDWLVTHFANVAADDFVVDVGCHDARDAQRLADGIRCRVVACDCSLPYLRSATIDFRVVVDAQDLPFRNGRLAGVVASNLIHLLPDRCRFFREAFRALRQGGRLVLLTALGADLTRPLIARYFPSIEGIDRARYGTEEEVVDGLRRAGFAAVSMRKLYLRRETVDERFVRVITQRTWSSLLCLSDDEYRSGVERLRSDTLAWQASGTTPSWENWKTVVVAGSAA